MTSLASISSKQEGSRRQLLVPAVSDFHRRNLGCLSCRLLRRVANPAHLAIIDEWESIEAHQNAAKAIPPEKMAQAMTLFARPPSGAYYTG
jgi:quinol monooxygenase YgiN